MPARQELATLLLGAIAAASVLLASGLAAACPFCVSTGETLSERRETASVVAIVERVDGDNGKPIWQMRHLIKGPGAKPRAAGSPDADATAIIPNAQAASSPVGLSLAFGVRGGDSESVAAESPLGWQFTPASEIAASYVVRAPDLRKPAAERLRYFARYLEHPDAPVAEDAFREFARAGYDDVKSVADALPMDKLRAWLADPATPPARRGFYGLALGMAREPGERRKNRDALQQAIVADKRDSAPGADFRPGFDGMLGGYLLLAGAAGLDELAQRYLANPEAREIDVRQTIAALRFYHEHGRDIPLTAQCAALRLALRRPQLADQAIIDLARWNDWDSLPAIAALSRDPAYAEPRIRRAIAGYLLTCPSPAAAEMVGKLRAQDPHAVESAERSLGREPIGAGAIPLAEPR